MNKKVLFAFLAVLVISVMTVSVSADQDGNKRWCWIDANGCWITGDDGEQWYIHFWSESARKFFMGDSTAPFTNVVDFPEDLRESGIMDLAPAQASHASSKAVILTPTIINNDEKETQPKADSKMETLINLFIQNNPTMDKEYLRSYILETYSGFPDSAMDEQINHLRNSLKQ